MIIPDKKKLATIILNRPKEGARDLLPVKPETDARDESALDAITHDIMQSIKDGSATGLKDALRAFIEEHGVSEPEESQPEE